MGALEKMFLIIYIILIFITLTLYKVIINKIPKKRMLWRRMVKIITIIIFFVLLFWGIRTGIWLYKNPSITDPVYDRGIYSIVFYNETDQEISGIEILVGENKVHYETVNHLRPKEYRKINIMTHQSVFIDGLMPPYNVYIHSDIDKDDNWCIGYFGIDTGGFELVKIVEDENATFNFQRASHETAEYIKCYRKDRRNQNLLSWQ